MHLSKTEHDLLIAAIPAAAALCVGLLSALAAYLASKRERRRALYSEATKAAVAWGEMLYRVRRRRVDQEWELVSLFHEVQAQITYYDAWVGSESVYIKRSYDRLVREIKFASRDLIRSAWDAEPAARPGNAPLDEVNPDVSMHVDRFLRDVRSQLSPWPWRKLAVRWRNRDGE